MTPADPHAAMTATARQSKLLFVSTDVRGSTHVVADANGRSLGWLRYGPFGEAVETGGANGGDGLARLTRRYAGQVFEPETGLYHCGARPYDAALARFVAPDPDHQTASAYAYCANDPVDHVDADGAMFELVIYFPRERKFRGYLPGGAFIGFELSEDPDETWTKHSMYQYVQTSEGTINAAFESHAVWQALRIYGWHVDPDIDLGIETIRKSGRHPAAKKRMWMQVVEALKKSKACVEFDDLPMPLQRKAGSVLEPGEIRVVPLPGLSVRKPFEMMVHKAPPISMEEVVKAQSDQRPGNVAARRQLSSVVAADEPSASPQSQPPNAQRAVGNKLVRRALAVLYRYEPYATPRMRRVVDDVALHFLAPPERSSTMPQTVPRTSVMSNTTMTTQGPPSPQTPIDLEESEAL